VSDSGPTETPVLSFPRALEPFDYLMLRGEGDPRSRTGAATVAMLDVVPDVARLRAAFERASRVVLRLRQHVVVPTLPLGPAEWVTDPDFDLDFHLRHIRLPDPGSMRQLLDYTTQLIAAPFDLARPLWEVVLVDGITEGDSPAALVIKIHHAVTDGVGGVEMFRQLYDFERELDRGPLPPLPSPEDLTPTDLTRNAVRKLPITAVRETVRRVSRGARLGRQFVEQPARAVGDVGKLVASAQRVLGASSAPSSPLLRRRSLGRRLESLELPLADLRAAGKAAGGSVNDAYIAALCGALRLYHEAFGMPVETVPLAMPVNLRTDDDPAGGNRFAGARIAAPVGERDPAKRIADIRQQVLTAVAEPAINILSVIAPIAIRLPAPLLAAVSSATGGIDVQASNVPGFTDQTYIAGARIMSLLPFGPLPGVPMMIVLTTQAGMCYVGAHYDTASITDADLFAKCLRDGFDEVLALKPPEATPRRASTKRASRKRPAKKVGTK
jgi:diacylglycerol O-acyltransferase